MKTSAKWSIGIGVGIISVCILIGLLSFIIKFFIKRCRKKAWDDITILPKDMDSPENGINYRKFLKRKPSERQPLYQSATNNAMEVSDNHVSIPIKENNVPTDQCDLEEGREQDHTLVQIQRDRLNRLKEEENRLRPMIRLSPGENDIQHVIDQAQKEFEESV
jgi:hypothetical protein